MNGIIVVDKAKDFTSFDVVNKLKKLFNEKKLGHAGTLDPMATGVLPVFIGRAAKFISLIPDHNKSYEAVIKLGFRTDTMDITGKVIERTNKIHTDETQIIEVLKTFKGNIEQIPPMFSAIKKNGVRLYTLARKGISIKREARMVNINSLDLIYYNPKYAELKIKLTCSKGTYVRTLSDDIGLRLGCFATLIQLRRTEACGLKLNSALSLEEIESIQGKGNMSDYIIPTDTLFLDYKCVQVTNPQKVRIINGGFLDISRLCITQAVEEGERLRMYAPNSEFLALAEVRGNRVCPIKLNITI